MGSEPSGRSGEPTWGSGRAVVLWCCRTASVRCFCRRCDRHDISLCRSKNPACGPKKYTSYRSHRVCRPTLRASNSPPERSSIFSMAWCSADARTIFPWCFASGWERKQHQVRAEKMLVRTLTRKRHLGQHFSYLLNRVHIPDGNERVIDGSFYQQVHVFSSASLTQFLLWSSS